MRISKFKSLENQTISNQDTPRGRENTSAVVKWKRMWKVCDTKKFFTSSSYLLLGIASYQASPICSLPLQDSLELRENEGEIEEVKLFEGLRFHTESRP